MTTSRRSAVYRPLQTIEFAGGGKDGTRRRGSKRDEPGITAKAKPVLITGGQNADAHQQTWRNMQHRYGVIMIIIGTRFTKQCSDVGGARAPTRRGKITI